MTFKSLQDCCLELEKQDQLIRIKEELDPHFVIPEIHRRIYKAQGPALLFEKIKGSPYKAVSNIFGTTQRCEFIFADVLKKFEWLIKTKMDPLSVAKAPVEFLRHVPFLLSALPASRTNKLQTSGCKISDLPAIKSWPMDGGSFITLPQVISFPPGTFDPKQANVGMYRIQLDGNDYHTDTEIGLHYQLHRGIGIHHLQHKEKGLPFKISIAVGGPPAYTLASIFPLPEGLSEILFSGLLNNRRYRYAIYDGYFIPQDVDFCICGEIAENDLKLEGPFGDHLGYYSLAHPFPYLKNIKIYHKPDPIWHFTVVGRPPQEDSSFGYLIHHLVSALSANEYPGIKALHAVDAAGVHPLLLAIGSERYMPFRDPVPEEILTQANHLLGKGQTSLAKYLFIAAESQSHPIDIYNIPAFLEYILERADFKRDLHFYTKTTIDTLDYSGEGWNAGSKLVIAAHGPAIRNLGTTLSAFEKLPLPFCKAQLIQKGVVTIQSNPFLSYSDAQREIQILSEFLDQSPFSEFPLIILVDDAEFVKENFNNFLWVTFTRSNPSHDIYGVRSGFLNKHWYCDAPMIIDARKKPHHAPELVVDPQTESSVTEFMKSHALLRKYIS